MKLQFTPEALALFNKLKSSDGRITCSELHEDVCGTPNEMLKASPRRF